MEVIEDFIATNGEHYLKGNVLFEDECLNLSDEDYRYLRPIKRWY